MIEHPRLQQPAGASVFPPGRARVEALLLRSPYYRPLRGLLDKLVASGSLIYLVGEMGTGKMLLARHIHAISGARGQLVSVNCKVLGEAQLDAELFGSSGLEEGGRGNRRVGAWEAAQHGVLLLDEVEHLPPRLQTKLLRVIERGCLDWAPDQAPKGPFSLRLVVGSTQDLRVAVEDGRFRQDVFYRIDVAPIHLLPLRERTEDIPALADYFLHLLGNGRPLALSPEALRLLQTHPWPGNMREMENVLHQTIVLVREGLITPEALLPLLKTGVAREASLPVSERYLAQFRRLLKEAFAQERGAIFESVERAMIETAHEYFGGNHAAAARALSISRQQYRSALKRQALPASEASAQAGVPCRGGHAGVTRGD